MPKPKEEWGHMRGKFLTTVGAALLVYGALKFYGVDSNVVWMILGAGLLLKGLWLKMK